MIGTAATVQADDTFWLLGSHLNQPSRRIVIDRQSRREVIGRPRHTQLVILMQHRAPVLLLLGLAALFNPIH